MALYTSSWLHQLDTLPLYLVNKCFGFSHVLIEIWGEGDDCRERKQVFRYSDSFSAIDS